MLSRSSPLLQVGSRIRADPALAGVGTGATLFQKQGRVQKDFAAKMRRRNSESVTDLRVRWLWIRVRIPRACRKRKSEKSQKLVRQEILLRGKEPTLPRASDALASWYVFRAFPTAPRSRRRSYGTMLFRADELDE